MDVGSFVEGTLTGILVTSFVRWLVSRKRPEDKGVSSELIPTPSNSSETATLVLHPDVVPKEDIQPNCLVLGPRDNPMVKIILRDEGDQPRFTRIGSNLNTSRLSALLQPAVNAMSELGHAHTKTLELVFAPEVARQLSEGTNSLMAASSGGFHATAVNAHGNIVGQGWMKYATEIDWSQASIGFWNVLTIVTSQYHLAEINKKLSEVSGALRDISQWLEHKAVSEIEGNLAYLSSIVLTISEHRYEENEIQTFSTKLEDVHQQVYQAFSFFDKQVKSVIGETELQLVKGKGYDNNKKTLINSIEDFVRFAGYRNSIIQLSVLTSQLRCCLPIHRSLSIDRLEEALNLLKDHRPQVREFKTMISNKIDELSDIPQNTPGINKIPLFDENRHAKDKKYIIRLLNDKTSSVSAESLNIEKFARRSYDQLTMSLLPSEEKRLLITLDKGEITEVYQVSAT